jgi:hypothetical protein
MIAQAGCRVITLGVFLLCIGRISAQGRVDALQYPLLYAGNVAIAGMAFSRPVAPPMYATLTVDPDVAALWRRSPKVTSFFCRTELLIERKSILAPRFRLGSLDYTEWMEGKRSFLSN